LCTIKTNNSLLANGEEEEEGELDVRLNVNKLETKRKRN
jgi:hypothetical protein